MRIEFDTGNETELTAVFVMLAVLRGGDLSLPQLDDQDAPPSVATFTGTGALATIAVPPAPPAAAVPAPPVPPVAAVPAPPVPPAPPAAAVPAPPVGVDVDAEGLPWDKRIHSTPATKKADGHWRKKRGIDDATVATVTAELKQAMAAPAPAAAPPVPVAQGGAPAADMTTALAQSREHLAGTGAPPLPPAAPAAVPPPPALADTGNGGSGDAATAFGAGAAAPASEPAAPPVPPAPVAPAAPPVPAAPPAPAGISFADLMRKITGLQTAGTLTVEGTQQIAQSLGITGVRDLMHRPDLIPSFDALLPQPA